MPIFMYIVGKCVPKIVNFSYTSHPVIGWCSSCSVFNLLCDYVMSFVMFVFWSLGDFECPFCIFRLSFIKDFIETLAEPLNLKTSMTYTFSSVQKSSYPE